MNVLESWNPEERLLLPSVLKKRCLYPWGTKLRPHSFGWLNGLVILLASGKPIPRHSIWSGVSGWCGLLRTWSQDQCQEAGPAGSPGLTEPGCLGPGRGHCSVPGRGHAGGSHNPCPHSDKYQTRRHQGTCVTCQSHRDVQLHTHGGGGGGWTCLTLMESVKVFFLDIKGSKSHKCEKQAPPIFL